MAVYSIRELEKLSGIKAHTIRIWEKRYKLIEPHRTNTNIRYYTDANLKKILNVAVLNRQGIKISHIAMLSEQELKEEIKRATVSTSSHQTLVDSLVIAMIDLDQYILESIIDKSISKNGFQETVTGVPLSVYQKGGHPLAIRRSQPGPGTFCFQSNPAENDCCNRQVTQYFSS